MLNRTSRGLFIISFVLVFSFPLSIPGFSYTLDDSYALDNVISYDSPSGSLPSKLFRFSNGDFLLSIRYNSGSDGEYEEIIKTDRNGTKIWSFFTNLLGRGYLHDFVEDVENKSCLMLIQGANTLTLTRYDIYTKEILYTTTLTMDFSSYSGFRYNAWIIKDGLNIFTVYFRYDGAVYNKDILVIKKYLLNPNNLTTLEQKGVMEFAGPKTFYQLCDSLYDSTLKRLAVLAKAKNSGTGDRNYTFIDLFDLSTDTPVLIRSENKTIPEDINMVPVRLAKDLNSDRYTLYSKNQSHVIIHTLRSDFSSHSILVSSELNYSINGFSKFYPGFDVMVGKRVFDSGSVACLIFNDKTASSITEQSLKIKEYSQSDEFISVEITSQFFLILGQKNSKTVILYINASTSIPTELEGSIWQNPYMIGGIIIGAGVLVFVIEELNRRKLH
jgi:hypothetical protein